MQQANEFDIIQH